MAVKLYRRHRKECEGGHREDARSGEFEEGRRGWKRCACLIHTSGTIGGKFNRKHTGKHDWDEAKAVVAMWETAGAWDGPGPPASPTASEPTQPVESAPARVTIAEASQVFLTNREGKQIAAPTLRKYKTFIKQLTAFADARGYLLLDQFTPADLDVFYSTWKLGARTKGKRLGTLRGFFRFCVHRKWLAESPVSVDLKPPIGANRVANKAPFTDDELTRIITACDHVKVEWKNETGTGEWNGEDVKDIIWLMVYTGYRISDATFFDITRLDSNEIFIRAKKNGGDVFTYVPDWLRDRLRARAQRHGRRPFLAGRSDRLETATNLWRRKITRAFDHAGVFDEPATPHRFRHTFARILLQRGVPVADVADLMGDDEETIRRHYARWVPERQARLTKILQDAFDRPKSSDHANAGRLGTADGQS